MTDDDTLLPADEAEAAVNARRNMQALAAELRERGCETTVFNEDGESTRGLPGHLTFDIEAPEGYQVHVVVPGVPTEVLRAAVPGSRWILRWGNHQTFHWSEIVDKLATLAQGQRTIIANVELLVAELCSRGLPLRTDEVGPDWDAAGDEWVTYDLPVNDEVVCVSIPDQPVGPGLDQVMYVQGEEYAWEAAVAAVFAEAGVPMAEQGIAGR
ncbi:hypothetical protein [Streptomyces odontomachi]|uniref:hypothetical protein n=1 Tax=Streptomyces odontomachi TaxID=2944940 RepID=UPI002109A2B7|nr:hypothetical protein [Streptomyces sp. ODS25]